MKMPNNNQSIVADVKITGYLLSDTHEDGKSKANFFKLHGFSIDDIEVIRRSLIEHAATRDISDTENCPYGIKYVLECEVNTPSLRNPCIRTVWIIKNGESVPILVTAYPF